MDLSLVMFSQCVVKVGEDGTDDDVYIEICSDLNNLVSCCRYFFFLYVYLSSNSY